jgi:peptide/nickel transport system permease protein
MVRFLVRRLALGAVVMALLSFLSWLVFATALNPLWVFWADPKAPEALAAAKRAHMHDPVLLRYWLWLKGLFGGHGLGRTVVSNTPVWPVVEPALVRSLELVAASLVLVVLLSMLVGTVSAERRGSPLDVGLRTFSYAAWAMPAFLLALLLFGGGNALSRHWHSYPLAIAGPPTGAGDWVQHMTLPALAVALGFVGAYSRYLRSSLIAALGEQYAVVARAKGLSERRVLFRHVLRLALVPMAGALALDFGMIFTATLAADEVFGLNGLATVFLNGSYSLGDPFMIEAIVLVSAGMVVVAGILGELACAWLDPRIRLS